ncbi:MAG: family 78 glycoside hydrolase catalytic domain [Novosphingobium sp.]|nr:family 78 glycoside hydrolase catalytic domain [Novosphingobium sp.]
MEVNRRQAIGIGLAGAGALTQAPVLAWATPGGTAPAIARPRVCGLDNPLSLGALPPRFSWLVNGKGASDRQAAYRVTVARTAADLAAGANLLWDSGKIASSQNFDIPYGGPALPPRAHAVWQVEVWPAGGGASLKSPHAIWETGLGEDPEWAGQWLASETEVARLDRMAGLHWITGSGSQKADAPRFFRTTIEVKKDEPAELLLSAHELLGVWYNGEPLSNPQDGPVRWAVMPVYPVTLKRGRNTIAVAIKRVVAFGDPPPALATILRHGKALKERLTSAQGWKTTLEETAGWQAHGFDDSGWEDATPSKSKPKGEPWPVYPANLLRKRFTLAKPVRSARLYATALGAYEAWLNGGKLGTQRMTPDYTDPSKRIIYQAHDVTAQLVPGANTLGLWVGDGWYGSKFSKLARFSFGPAPCRALAQLEIEYTDGSREVIATGDGWEIAQSPIREASIYDGEVFDARMETDWTGPNASTKGWRAAETIATQPPPIDPERCPPVRANEVLSPRSITRLANGRHVVDFGQNFAGWPRLTVTAPAGTRIEMRFAELLLPSGTVDQSNLRTAWQRDVYIAAGTGKEVWEPRFTYHGFRYVELNGLPDDAGSWSLEALVGYQDLDLTGDFRTADPVIQKFWRNSVWSQKSNFWGLPTDCPQRDERLGWMGDAEVFWPAAAYNMDVTAYTARVMEDVRASQRGNGGFPDVIPPFAPGMDFSSPGWADAGVILPYTSWQQNGDTGVIAANWEAMERYMDWLLKTNPNHLWEKYRGADYGDWLSVDANPANPADATTPKDLIGTAYWAQNAATMAEMAEATGNAAAAARYRTLFADIKAAFNAAYVKPDGTVGNDSQTSYVLAIRFGLLSPKAAKEAGRRLAADIARRGGHLSTGFLGTPHILDALAMTGQEETAITLLLQRGYPSWGYMVTKGATSMWERWNSDTGDNSMNSYNHYAFGAIGSFLFRRIAGIAPASAGFGRVRIAPIMDERLGKAGATYRSASGPIATEWQAADGRFQLDVELPPNAAAEVVLPGGKTAKAGPGLHRYSDKL